MSYQHFPTRALALCGLLAAALAPEAHAGLFGGSACSEPIGSVRISEPDDGAELWSAYGLSAPTRMLRVMVNDSRCFTVVDRGAGLAAIREEQELAAAGQLRAGHNVGGGQIRSADFVLIPDIVSQNANAGGSSFGVEGEKRGFLGMGGGKAGVSTRRQNAEVVLTLVDARTSEQVITTSGEAKISDKAWEAALRAQSNAHGARGGIHYSSWENTEIGKVIKQAYEEAYEKMEPAVRRLARQRGAGGSRQSALASTMGMFKPGLGGGAPAQVATEGDVSAVRATSAGQGLRSLLPRRAQQEQAVAEVEEVEEQATALQPAPAPQVVVEPAPVAVPAPVAAPAGAPLDMDAEGELLASQTLALRRTARLLAQPAADAEVVAELRTGMLLFPTGSKQGAMLEVENEVGQRGWVPSAAVVVAQ